jgi:phosphoglycerol transferase MdoB-like AlkP superfamily enzyme
MSEQLYYIISQKDYPSEKILSTLGVPDHVMFDTALPKLDAIAKEGKPFLSVFLTASNHSPHVIPDEFKPLTRFTSKDAQVKEYTDWSIRHFLNAASHKPWFNNTLFVITSDHGAAIDRTYEIPLSFHHIPLLFYAPNIVKPAFNYSLGGQIDIFPTIMNFLKINYSNVTAGIDLLNEERECIYFCADDKIGVIQDNLFLVLNPEGNIAAYNFMDKSTIDVKTEKLSQVKYMKLYAEAMMQATYYMKN